MKNRSSIHPLKMSYESLKKLIDERRKKEKKLHPPLLEKYQTTVNFQDINGKSLLHYAAEEGLLEQVKELLTQGIDNIKADINLKILGNSRVKTPIQSALEAGQLEVAEYLYNQGAELPGLFTQIIKDNKCCEWFYNVSKKQETLPFKPPLPYTDSALHGAIQLRQFDKVKELLSKGANINWRGRRKYTPLMMAILVNHEEIVNYLLQQKADITLLDTQGNNIIHLAVQAGNITILSILLENIGKDSPLLLQKNMYGESAIEMACSKNRPDMLTMLDDTAFIPTQQLIKIPISQGRILPKMHYYLRQHYRDETYLPFEGQCNGFVYLHNYYSAKKMRDYFFDTLALLSEWDGTPEMLMCLLPQSLPQSRHYKNLNDLFEQWTNDIIFFQHANLYDISTLSLEQRAEQYAIAGYEPTYAPELIIKISAYSTPLQIEEILTYLNKMPSGIQIEIGGEKHAVTADLEENQKINHYDPNFDFKLPVLSSNEIRIWLQRIIDFKYIQLGKYPSNGFFSIVFLLFIPKKYRDRINETYEIFKNETYPHNKEDVQSFQAKSANKFTPLHVAVLTGSLASVKRLLDDGYCDINALDNLGNTALSLATKIVDKTILNKIVNLLLTHPLRQSLTDKDIEFFHGFYGLRVSCTDKDEDSFFSEPPILKSLTTLLPTNNLPLIKLIIARAKEKEEDLKPYLADAIQSPAIDKEIIAHLISMGGKWTAKTPHLKSAMELVIKSYPQFYTLMRNTLSDINVLDDYGKGLIHYAVKYGRFDMIQDILKHHGKLPAETLQNLAQFIQNLNFNENDDKELLSLVKNIFLQNPQLLSEDINNEDKQAFNNLIHFSILMDKPDLFSWLLKNTPHSVLNLNPKDVTTKGKLLLVSAVERSLSYVNNLLKARINTNLQERHTGNTALHFIISYRLRITQTFNEAYVSDLVIILLQNGANPNIENKYGKTPYQLAIDSGDISLINIFDAHMKQNKMPNGLTPNF